MFQKTFNMLIFVLLFITADSISFRSSLGKNKIRALTDYAARLVSFEILSLSRLNTNESLVMIMINFEL